MAISRDGDAAGMKYVASCSFGKDSLAMVLKLLQTEAPLDEVIFFDTGMEFDSIYNNRDRLRDLLINKGIQFTELRDSENFYYKMLVKPVKYRKLAERERESIHITMDMSGVVVDVDGEPLVN